MDALAFDDKISYVVLSYPPLGYPAENPSHVKVPRISRPTLKTHPIPNPSRSNGMGSTPPIAIPSHGMGPMGRVHGTGYPIFFRLLAIYDVNCKRKKPDRFFMHFVIESIVENRFHDLIIPIYFSRF